MKKPDHCKTCTLYKAPGPVPGEGKLDAPLMYIAEAPGQTEIEQQRPLCGPSGKVYNRQLAQTGLRRGTQVYTTNLIKCKTPGNRTPTHSEIQHCSRFLDQELDRSKAKVVVLAGSTSFKHLIGTYSTIGMVGWTPPTSISLRGGCVEVMNGKWWIGTLHPAFVMRKGEVGYLALEHLRKAKALLDIPVQVPDVKWGLTEPEIKSYIEEHHDSDLFSEDVETKWSNVVVAEDDYVGSDAEVTVCGLAMHPWRAIMLDPPQIPLLAPLVYNPLKTCTEHNGSYDRYHLYKRLPPPWTSRRMDTMVGQHYLFNISNAALKPYTLALCTHLPYYDRELHKVHEPWYCGMDVLTTYQASRFQTTRMATYY